MEKRKQDDDKPRPPRVELPKNRVELPKKKTASSSLAGTQLGRFRISRLIGTGGMGEVYVAIDEHLDREVAVKVLGDDMNVEPHRRRFLREARLAARLNHPNIAAIYEVGDSDGRLYIVMELLEGQPLRNLITDRRLRMEEIVTIARDVARALARAHAGDVIHRDIKPENIFITKPAPDVLFAKVLDFGLARDELLRKSRSDEDSTATDLTGPGEACGTAGYLAPEQARGLAVDVRADIFSFGAVLYEMLTGRRAFDGRNQLQRMLAVVKHKPEPVKLRAPDVSPELEAILDRCLSKTSAERFADGGALLAALEQLLKSTPSQAKMPAVGPPARPVVDLSSRHLIADMAYDETEVMAEAPLKPPRPSPAPPPPPSSSSREVSAAPAADVPSTSSSAAILAAESVDQDPSSGSSDASASRRKAVSTSTPAPTTKSTGSNTRMKSMPIPYPVLSKWLTPAQRRLVKPLAKVAAAGVLLSLCIIIGLSLGASGNRPKKTTVASLAPTPRTPEVAAARELSGAADGLGPKNESSSDNGGSSTPTDPAEATGSTSDSNANANSEPPPPPPVAAAQTPPPPTRTAAAPATGFTKLPPVHTSVAPTPAPPPLTPAAAPAAPAVAAQVKTGTVHVSGSDLTIVVDGEYRRLNNGNVVLSCGRHRIRVGVKMDQVVDVPCGGTISL